MSTHLQNVTWLNAGSCRQLAYFAGQRSLSIERFPAVVVYFEHPQQGPYLIDTGYSSAVWDATRGFPQRVHRWATPLTLSPHSNAAGELIHAGIDPQAIQRILLSHFHVDHIGGVTCFERAKFVYRHQGLSELRSKKLREQLHHGFLDELLPHDFSDRSEHINEQDFTPGEGLLRGFLTLDLFADGSLILVDLPGHAIGHTGYLLNTIHGPVFYIVDATWNMGVLKSRRELPRLTRYLQHDYAAYRTTQLALLNIAERVRMLACHCPETQRELRSDAY